MTSIEWLSVQGIRSFSPELSQTQKIKFFKPLTIILGQNGAGKTTIIETLKNACTGELPPNADRGRYFIHDPKVCGKSEVKAQIRLQFRAATQQRMVVVRSFQLTQREKKSEFKQLDGVVQMKSADGKVSNQSHKCGEIDQLIPELIGVSKAVLENVIFCHQEDTNWPLQESSKVKKKFDDIFAATRYTKALDAIHTLNKEQNSSLKDFRGELGVLEAHLSQAEKIRSDIENQSYKAEQINSQVEKIDEQLQKYQDAINAAEEIWDQLKEKQNTIQQKEGQYNALSQTVSELYEQLEQEFSESDEEVFQFEKEFIAQLESLKKDRDKLEIDLGKYRNQKETASKKFNELNTKEGVVQSELNKYNEKRQNVIKLVHQISSRNNISDFDNDELSDAQLDEFGERMESMLSQNRDELHEIRAVHQSEESKITKSLNEAQVKHSSQNQQFQDKSSRKKQLEEKSEQATKKLDDLNVSEEDLNSLENQVSQMSSEYETKLKEFEEKDLKSQIESLRSRIDDASNSMKELRKNMKEREEEQEATVRIRYKRSNTEAKENEYKSTIESTKKQFSEYGVEIADEPLKLQSNLDEKIQEKKTIVSQNQQKLQTEQGNLSNLKGRLSMYDEQIQSMKKHISESEEKIRSVCKDNLDLPSIMSTAEEQLQDLRNEVSMIESLTLCYKNFIKQSQEQHECPVCARSLSEEELGPFIELQENKLNQAPEHLERKKKKLEKVQTLHSKLQQLMPVYDQMNKIKETDLPEIEQKQKSCGEEKEEIESNVAQLNSKLETAQKDENNISSLNSSVTQLIRVFDEYKKQKEELEKEEEKVKSSGTGKSYDELQTEYDQQQKIFDQLSIELEETRSTQKQYEKELQESESRLRETQNDLESKKMLWESRKQYQEQLVSIQEEFSSLQNQLENLEENLPKIEKEVEQIQNQLDAQRKENQQKQNQLQETVDQISQDATTIRSAIDELKSYNHEQKEKELKEITNHKQNMQDKLDKLSAKVNEWETDLRKKDAMVDKQGEIKRNIEDNINYRRKRQELQNLETEVQKLKQSVQEMTGNQDMEELERQKEKRNELSNQRSEFIGVRDTIADRINHSKKELQSETYRDIDQRHKSAMIKVKTTEMAVQDLTSYHTALSKALMKFHSIKMAEINAIIKELWQKTYRGQDIDSIEIRADQEGASARSKFKYRVVMKKGDVALDMRGRCSAGQKVLASLIIRLALAEAFCIDCGVLALDEPTTNLDADNVASLAEALHAIIEERRAQSNFQLVVITHDEEFVQKLGRSEYVDSYYRVSKDPTTLCSIIEEQEI
eukprot:gb/GECH01001038.1/.p1 GENE.gb/GECH01001038.1/~~gb/GECH01001038.1/.p1  ORF type:complete len:1307 (+),score=500.08 gb/GECH01001038.1/:1-3921(+)